MTVDDGSAAVAVTLSGAVQPDASGGVGDPLAKADPRIEPATQALYARHPMWRGTGNGTYATISPILWADLDAEEQEPYRSDIPITLAAADAADRAAGIVRLDLDDPALPDRLGDWKFYSEHAGLEADYCTRYLAAHPEDRARYRLWAVALLAELGRAG